LLNSLIIYHFLTDKTHQYGLNFCHYPTMSGFIMNKIYNFLTTSLAVILLSALAGCNPPSNSTGASGQEPPLAGAKIGGEFTLTNQDGEKASDTDFSGQYRIV